MANKPVETVENVVETVAETAVCNIKFIRERDITYKDDAGTQKHFSVINIRFTDKVVKTLTKLGEDISTDTIDFERSYWYARIRELVPSIDAYLTDERPFVAKDKFFSDISIEIEQVLHTAGDIIPDTNKTYRNSGYSTDILKFKLGDIAKLQLKWYILRAAFMDDAANEVETKLKAALATDAKDALAALDAL